MRWMRLGGCWLVGLYGVFIQNGGVGHVSKPLISKPLISKPINPFPSFVPRLTTRPPPPLPPPRRLRSLVRLRGVYRPFGLRVIWSPVYVWAGLDVFAAGVDAEGWVVEGGS